MLEDIRLVPRDSVLGATIAAVHAEVDETVEVETEDTTVAATEAAATAEVAEEAVVRLEILLEEEEEDIECVLLGGGKLLTKGLLLSRSARR